MNGSAGTERLHKYLAHAGVASRRASEGLIADGRVQVNGKTVTQNGARIDPAHDTVTFDGEPVRAEAPVHYLVYKPRGVVCTTQDAHGRKSVVDLVSDRQGRRLYPVGRLEEESEGLIVVTNDGGLTERIMRRGNPLRHSYYVRVRGSLTQEALDKVRQGLWLSDGRSGPMNVKVLRWGKKMATLLCSPSAQQHRTLRRVWSKVGLQPDKLVRVKFGPLDTVGLKKGGVRRLRDEEIAQLLDPNLDSDQQSPYPQNPKRGKRPAPGGRGGPGARGGPGSRRPGPARGGKRGPHVGPGRKPTQKPLRKPRPASGGESEGPTRRVIL